MEWDREAAQGPRERNGNMKNFILVSGWVAAIALVILGFFQQQKLTALQTEAADAEALKTELAASVAKVTALEQQRDTLEASLAKVEPVENATADTAGTANPDVDPMALLKGLFGKGEASGSSADPSKTEKSANPFTAMFEGEQGEKMMEASMEMAIDMQYGPLFTELGLTPEKAEALRAVLSDHQRVAMEGGMAMMRGELKADELEVPSEDELMARVAEVLDEGELEKFSAYQEALPEKMMRQQMEMQVNMFAGGLSEESRAVTVDILVENLLPPEGVEQNPASADSMAHMESGYENALTEIDQALAPEEAAQVRRFIEQQQASVRMFTELMTKPEEEKPGTPAVP